MATGIASTDFLPIDGVRLSAVSAGIKSEGQEDLVLIEFDEGSETVGVFTQSHFAAAPVIVGKRHLAETPARFFLINSGNANAGVGDAGIEDAIACCKAVAAETSVQPHAVIPFSTGVIGERLPVDKIAHSIPEAVSRLSREGWPDAARGIMTTDTRAKIASRQVEIAGTKVTLTGISKGAGMIQPNMATMLAYIATDASCDVASLQSLLSESVEYSFNRITVDSDTSTNDSCMLTATGKSGVDVSHGAAREQFAGALLSVCQELAQAIIRDGEGATKFVAVTVQGGSNSEQCLAVAYSIANSPLIKTALFASDANWGRIVMAIGKAPTDVDINRLDVYLGDVQLMSGGQKDPGYTEEAGSQVLAEEDITIRVDLNSGSESETVWTSDLSHEYVTINAEYRT